MIAALQTDRGALAAVFIWCTIVVVIAVILGIADYRSRRPYKLPSSGSPSPGSPSA